MNMMTRKTRMAFLAAQVALISVASARPGPPGHTHPDDWPFDLIAGLVAGALIVCAAKFIVKRG